MPPAPPPRVRVFCLCADWCGVCRDYRAVFDAVRTRLPQVDFIWVDVEDESDLVDPVEVDDFPTLLIGVGDSARFLGPVMPRAEPLERLVREHGTASSSATPGLSAQAAELLQRLLGLVE